MKEPRGSIDWGRGDTSHAGFDYLSPCPRVWRRCRTETCSLFPEVSRIDRSRSSLPTCWPNSVKKGAGEVPLLHLLRRCRATSSARDACRPENSRRRQMGQYETLIEPVWRSRDAGTACGEDSVPRCDTTSRVGIEWSHGRIPVPRLSGTAGLLITLDVLGRRRQQIWFLGHDVRYAGMTIGTTLPWAKTETPRLRRSGRIRSMRPCARIVPVQRAPDQQIEHLARCKQLGLARASSRTSTIPYGINRRAKKHTTSRSSNIFSPALHRTRAGPRAGAGWHWRSKSTPAVFSLSERKIPH